MKEIFDAYVKAMNDGNIDEVMTLMAENVSLINFRYRPVSPISNSRDLLRAYITESIIEQNGQIFPIDFSETDNRIEGKVEVRSDRITKAGFERIIGFEKFTIENAKITQFEFQMDLSDETTCGFLEFVKNLEANRPK
ncbi:hypothetical protein GCM10011514_36880 [Emticicia aquatilis]|uniref:Uncharacterized protein n=1 Tax=Emticicia aquatilis TaxID=1537369 RepID=A0A917DTG6_9BACT|nr:nuclear transport factor 2 family protein [Emticicia aquatilis]GGD69392.1 hypothetical protein GCM10011514_36880 [Emticicia aquatilis]